MPSENLRRHPRRTLELPARLHLDWGQLEGTIENIGEGGAFFVTDTLEGAVAEGDLIARGRVVGTSEDHCLAEAVVVDSEGGELGRGTGIFVKTETPLSSDMGYE